MNKSFRSRVGNVMRRSSVILTMSRPTTPALSDSDANSLSSQKQPETAALVPPVHEPVVPSPIAESPAREAQALAGEPVGASPLAIPVEVDPTTENVAEVPTTAEVSAPIISVPEVVETAPTPISPPAVAGPGAFTDEPVDLQETQDKVSEDAQEGGEGLVAVESPTEASVSVEQPAVPVQLTPQMISPPLPPTSFPVEMASEDVGITQPLIPEESVSISVPMYPQGSPRESYASLAPAAQGVEVNYDKQLTSSIVQGNGSASYGVSEASSIKMPTADPFADSNIAPTFVGTPKNGVHMPIPAHSEPSRSFLDQPDDALYGQILMPLPAAQDVMAARSVRNTASAYSLVGGKIPTAHDTDERRPLLSRPVTPNHDKNTSYLPPTGSGHVAVSSRLGQPSSSVSTPLLHNLGWIEYVLPDASSYYVHPTLRVTTDIDLRNTKKLEAVSAYLDQKDAGASVGLEIWLREPTTTKRYFEPVRVWIDHRKRGVSFDTPSTRDGAASKSKQPQNDRLDMEYRYWSFVEAHPAHTSLPANARVEAVDALSWAYADRLLPAHQRAPPPFTQEECQELMNLLRTFGETPADSGIHTMVHTRIVARILLRVAHWRQIHFRPNKPLPLDATPHKRARRPSFSRTVVDFFISCLCLGIPYFFMERSYMLRADEEGGLRSAGPKLVLWACTCLVAALVLSTSVTFLSLPGLDNIARIAGFVAILLSTASITSSVIALFRFKSDIERAMASMGAEGLVMQPRRIVVWSLPFVFLAYSLTAFIVGISLYSFRGVASTDPRQVTRPFDDYTKWTVVGAIGGLVCVLAASVLLSRR